MPSIKILHYTKKVYTDGTSPVILQIISGKQIKRKVLASVTPDQWNDDKKRVRDKKHPNATVINEKIREDFNKYEDLVLKLSKDESIADIFKEETEVIVEVKIVTRMSYFDLADIYLKGIKLQSGFSYDSFRRIIGKFERFAKTRNLYQEDFTEELIHSYIQYLRAIPNKDVTINNNLRVLRFPSAFGARMKTIPWSKPDALHNFKLPPKTRGRKKKLSKEEFKAFCGVELNPGTRIRAAQKLFMTAYYLRGMRISDVLQIKKSSIVNNIYVYDTQKTDANFNIKLPNAVLEVVKEFKDREGVYLFPFLKWEYDNSIDLGENNLNKTIALKNATSYVNNLLKLIAKKAGIETSIHSHVSRHTFARDALKKIKDPNITMKLTGHTSLEIHQLYATEVLSDEELDTAADLIFEDEPED